MWRMVQKKMKKCKIMIDNSSVKVYIAGKERMRGNMSKDDIEAAYRRLEIRKQIFEDSKKPIFKKLRAMREEVERLQRKVAWLEKSCNNYRNLHRDLQQHVAQDQQDALDFRRIKTILGRAA